MKKKKMNGKMFLKEFRNVFIMNDINFIILLIQIL